MQSNCYATEKFLLFRGVTSCIWNNFVTGILVVIIVIPQQEKDNCRRSYSDGRYDSSANESADGHQNTDHGVLLGVWVIVCCLLDPSLYVGRQPYVYTQCKVVYMLYSTCAAITIAIIPKTSVRRLRKAHTMVIMMTKTKKSSGPS